MSNAKKREQNIESKNYSAITRIDKYIFYMLCIILVVEPLLIRMKELVFISPVISDTMLLGTGIVGDMFSYYKYVFMIICTCIIVLMFLYKMIFYKYMIKESYINAPLLAMMLFITLSAVFAEHKSIALFGHYNRHEGSIAYICYLTLFFIAANINYSEKRLRIIFYALFPFIVVNTILGLLNFYGHNIYDIAMIKNILIPAHINIQSGSYITSTINNPNYASAIAVTLLVMFIGLAIYDTSIKRKMVNIIASVFLFIMILSSLSTSGMVTLIISFPILIALIIMHHKRGVAAASFAIIIVLFILITIIMNYHNIQIYNEFFKSFINLVSYKIPALFGLFLLIILIGFYLAYIIKRFKNNAKLILIVTLIPALVFVFSFILLYENNSLDRLYNSLSEEIKTNSENLILPERGVTPGNGRLYIWGKTVELIKNKPILGYGLDTLPFYFPQNDILKYSNIGSYTNLVGNSHNLYISLAYGSGLPALIALLVLITLHVKNNINAFSEISVSTKNMYIVCIFLGWFAYLIQGMVNDSIIGTFPIFWILFGVSISYADHNNNLKVN